MLFMKNTLFGGTVYPNAGDIGLSWKATAAPVVVMIDSNDIDDIDDRSYLITENSRETASQKGLTICFVWLLNVHVYQQTTVRISVVGIDNSHRLWVY